MEDKESYNKLRWEVNELRPYFEKCKLREAEAKTLEKRILQLEDELHQALSDVYDLNNYIDRLNKQLESSAGQQKINIDEIKAKLTFWMTASQLGRLNAIGAFCPDDNTRIILQFDPVSGRLTYSTMQK